MGIKPFQSPPDGKRALFTGSLVTCILKDLETGLAVKTYTGHTSWVIAVSITPDGKRAISGSHDKTCILLGPGNGADTQKHFPGILMELTPFQSPQMAKRHSQLLGIILASSGILKPGKRSKYLQGILTMLNAVFNHSRWQKGYLWF